MDDPAHVILCVIICLVLGIAIGVSAEGTTIQKSCKTHGISEILGEVFDCQVHQVNGGGE